MKEKRKLVQRKEGKKKNHMEEREGEERRKEGKLNKNNSGKTRRALGYMFLFGNCWTFGSEFT